MKARKGTVSPESRDGIVVLNLVLSKPSAVVAQRAKPSGGAETSSIGSSILSGLSRLSDGWTVEEMPVRRLSSR